MEVPFYIQELIRASFLCRIKELQVEMGQQRKFWQPWLKDDMSKQHLAKQLPTTKWKRDRRSRVEYSRKSDPKIPEAFGCPDLPPPYIPNGDPYVPNGTISPFPASIIPHVESPLDMSVHHRGQPPPSYAQTISNPEFRSLYRSSSAVTPPVTTTSSQREDLPSGISMCDPIIDEHFRRSLGKDYSKVFSANNNVSKEVIAEVKTVPKTTNGTNVIELIDNAALSVDDHFAKALGDTWIKLNQKESITSDGTTVNSL